MGMSLAPGPQICPSCLREENWCRKTWDVTVCTTLDVFDVAGKRIGRAVEFAGGPFAKSRSPPLAVLIKAEGRWWPIAL